MSRVVTAGALIRVVLLADTRLYRDGVATVLRRSGQLHVVARSVSADARSDADAADVVVVAATDCDGPASLDAAIGEADVPVVAVGVEEDEELLIALAELGVVGFVGRDAGFDELVAAVENAARGAPTCPPHVTAILLRRVAEVAGRRAATAESSLTARERQIVQLIAEGLSNKEIAQRLCIELATVKNHVHNILEKLDVHGRDEAVARLQVIDRRPVERTLATSQPPRADMRSRSA